MKAPVRMSRLHAMGLGCVIAASAFAQDDNRSDVEKARDYVYRQLQVEEMIRQAAENVSARYNLNPQQTRFTQDLMNRRVHQFLSEHEDQIWPIVRDMVRYQNPNRKMDEKTAARLGKAIGPLFAEAQRAIYEGNSEWREILSDAQKQLHDHDLQKMGETFKEMDQRFDGWSNGEVRGNQSIFPDEKPDTPPIDPPVPPNDPPSKAVGGHLDYWDTHVQGFIEDYELDEGQANAARSILRELKDRATEFESAHTKDFREAQRRLEAATNEKDKAKIDAATAELDKLNEYKIRLFEELKKRLEPIPRPAQRQKYAEKMQKHGWERRPGFSVKKATKPTSRPATTAPAKADAATKAPKDKPVPTTQPAAKK